MFGFGANLINATLYIIIYLNYSLLDKILYHIILVVHEIDCCRSPKITNRIAKWTNGMKSIFLSCIPGIPVYPFNCIPVYPGTYLLFNNYLNTIFI